jgi:zinc transporter ZupT
MCAAIVAAAISTLGLLSMLVVGDWGRRHSPYFSAFAVGFLLVAVFFHLIPEAVSYSSDAWNSIAIGLGAMILIGVLLRITSKKRVDGGDLSLGYASVFVLGVHSMLDGVIYVTTFQEEFFTGGLATFGLLLHEFPEGIIAFFLLRTGGLNRLNAGFAAFIAASVTTIAGAFAAEALINKVDELPFSSLLGLTAGGLIYIIFLHLAPHASLTPHRRGYLMAGIGVIIALAALVFRELAGL